MNGKMRRLLRATRLSGPVREFSSHFSRTGMDRWLADVTRRLRDEVSSASVLNVGAGGELGGLIQGLPGANVISVDMDPRRKPTLVADACRLPFPDNTFDAAFALEVLEHIPTPEVAVRELARVLKPGGRLVVSTPFFFEMHEEPHDYYRFTLHGMRFLLRDMRDVTIQPRNGYFKALLAPLFRLWRSPHFFDACFGLYALAMALPMYPLIWVMEKAIRWPAATTGYLAECRKP
jgi:SAM-dependent methyltransferase